MASNEDIWIEQSNRYLEQTRHATDLWKADPVQALKQLQTLTENDQLLACSIWRWPIRMLSYVLNGNFLKHTYQQGAL
jgi:hypothetical protein